MNPFKRIFYLHLLSYFPMTGLNPHASLSNNFSRKFKKMCFLFFWIFLFGAVSIRAQAQCTSNNASPTLSNQPIPASGSVTLSLTISGTNPFLLASIWIGPNPASNADTVLSATYAAIPLTGAMKDQDTASPNHGDVETWYLVAPPAGTANLVVTTNFSAGITMALAGTE